MNFKGFIRVCSKGNVSKKNIPDPLNQGEADTESVLQWESWNFKCPHMGNKDDVQIYILPCIFILDVHTYYITTYMLSALVEYSYFFIFWTKTSEGHTESSVYTLDLRRIGVYTTVHSEGKFKSILFLFLSILLHLCFTECFCPNFAPKKLAAESLVIINTAASNQLS